MSGSDVSDDGGPGEAPVVQAEQSSMLPPAPAQVRKATYGEKFGSSFRYVLFGCSLAAVVGSVSGPRTAAPNGAYEFGQVMSLPILVLVVTALVALLPSTRPVPDPVPPPRNRLAFWLGVASVPLILAHLVLTTGGPAVYGDPVAAAPDEVPVVQVPVLNDPGAACQEFLDTFERLAQLDLGSPVVEAELTALRDGSQASAPLMARDLQTFLSAPSPDAVDTMVTDVVTRCLDEGDVNPDIVEEWVARLGAAASAAP
jgi:hypothetical protein